MRADESSRTALGVAKYVLYVDRDPRLESVLPPGSAALLEKILLSQSLISQRELDRLGAPWLKRSVRFFELVTMAGVPLAIGLRKRYFHEATVKAIAEGAEQILIVGAGLDPLGVLMAAAHPEIRVFEIDHPATQKTKRQALDHLGETPPNLQLVEADLTRIGVREVLARHPGWEETAQTLATAEGLLMYLPSGEVQALFGALAAVGGAGSRVVFSFVGADAAGRPHLGKMHRFGRILLALAGEPLRWGIAPRDLPRLLRGHGFDLHELMDRDGLRHRYLRGTELAAEPLSSFEYFAIGRRAR